MNFKLLALGITISGALLAACQPAPSGAKDEPAATAQEAPSANGAVVVPATITTITDAGYPMFAVTATVAAQTTPIELLLNAEAADLGGHELASYSGKPVTLGYTSLPETSLADIHRAGRSLFGADAPRLDPSWKIVTGVLSGAEDVTAGDLPSQITIANADGTKIAFEYFVGPELKAANGKEVTGYYTTDVVNRVTMIRPAA